MSAVPLSPRSAAQPFLTVSLKVASAEMPRGGELFVRARLIDDDDAHAQQTKVAKKGVWNETLTLTTQDEGAEQTVHVAVFEKLFRKDKLRGTARIELRYLKADEQHEVRLKLEPVVDDAGKTRSPRGKGDYGDYGRLLVGVRYAKHQRVDTKRAAAELAALVGGWNLGGGDATAQADAAAAAASNEEHDDAALTALAAGDARVWLRHLAVAELDGAPARVDGVEARDEHSIDVRLALAATKHVLVVTLPHDGHATGVEHVDSHTTELTTGPCVRARFVAGADVRPAHAVRVLLTVGTCDGAPVWSVKVHARALSTHAKVTGQTTVRAIFRVAQAAIEDAVAAGPRTGFERDDDARTHSVPAVVAAIARKDTKHGGTMDQLRATLDAGYDINAADTSDDRRTALHLALLAAAMPDDLVATLVDAGADPLLKDAHGVSALDLAKRAGRDTDALRKHY